MSTATGIYFDGQVTRGRAVTLHFTEDGQLRVEGEDLALAFELVRIRISDRLGDIPRFIYLPDEAVIETPDNAIIDAVLGARGQGRGSRFIHALESKQRFAAAACVLLVIALVVAGFYLPPVLARVVARRVPPEIDQRIGAASLAAIAAYFPASELGTYDRNRVLWQLTRLRANESPTPPRLEFRSTGGSLPNAFALPGNVIVVTDELVKLPATDDEIAAVLAHEMGHLEQRHGLQSLLRGSFALLVVAAVTGDLSTLTSFAASLPLTIINAGYSRDLEREADRHALALLRARGIDPHGFVSIMMKLEASRPEGMRASTYLSTHPETEERLALFGGVTPADESPRHFSRGIALARKRDYPKAITEFDAAIAGDPKRGDFYVQRAEARNYLGQTEEALADLEEAVRAGVQEKAILSSRGHMHWTLGHHEEAQRDFDELVKGPNAPAFAYRARAMLFYGQGNWARADSDLKFYFLLSKPRSEEYGEFFRFLVHQRRKLPADQARLRAAVEKWPVGWARSVGQYLDGEIKESELLNRTNTGTTPTHDERLCEAYYYIGEMYVLAGEPTVAAEFLEKCVATKVTYFYEYKLARDELARLKATE